MINELIFLMQVFTIATSVLIALRFGKSALVTFVCLSTILANFFVLKQTTLFGLTATCSDAFAIGATLGLNLLQEYFGKVTARTTIWLSFFFAFFFIMMSQLHLSFIPAPLDTKHSIYVELLQFMPRIAIASLATFLLAQTVDYLLYGWLRTVWHHRLLVIRNVISLLVSQLLDTILFTFLALYGILEGLWHIVFISYAIKIAIIFLAAPFIGIAKKVHSAEKLKQ